MGIFDRRARVGAITVMGLAVLAYVGGYAATGASAAPASVPRLATLSGSVSRTTDHIVGSYRSNRMSVEVALAPRDATGLTNSLRAIYTQHSASYHQWLGAGQFDARYAPTTATRNQVKNYLQNQGLQVVPSESPFLVHAVGSSQQVAAAFHTTLSNYRDPRGIRYYSNSTAVKVPAALASRVLGVVGLENTVREQTHVVRMPTPVRVSGAHSSTPKAPACETPYPTEQQLADLYLNDTPLPFGYGGGPGCNGMTPQQTNSIYNAPDVGRRGEGAGVNTAVFELSAYQQSDIDTWAHTFYGPRYNPPLRNVTVDGGPLNPICPAGDECPPSANGYAGDIEVDADIEMQLTISPDMSHLYVYNAPNDYTGQTELDEYTAIADQDIASSISSSWSVCENDVDAAYVQAENVVFEQMAMQGQSMFGAEGDTGAFSCIRSDGTTIVNVLDPPSQPWVTSVGGTSFEHFDPGANPAPSYPRGAETVWNYLDLCNATATNEDGLTGLDWCADDGAGGGGNSQWWGRPFYQKGPGVNNPYTQYGNGSTECALAATGTPCREDPDVSANADENTPYAEYCTGNASTPYSYCGTFSDKQTPPGWFGIGGTSLSSPLWSGIAADIDSFRGSRVGNLNPLLYSLFDSDPGLYFHDITGFGTPETNNGLFPTTRGYDEATGIGTPNMAALITKSG
jgi:subtilase family serine protease